MKLKNILRAIAPVAAQVIVAAPVIIAAVKPVIAALKKGKSGGR